MPSPENRTATPSQGERLAALAVHAYTAIGSVLALVLIHLAYTGEVQAFLWVLFASMVIDGTDGMLARRFRVKEVMPGFDGALLDNIVDYMTYVLAPMALLWANDYLPDGAWGGVVASIPILASCVQFCRTDAKPTMGGEHFFLGFPCYWNVVVLYVVALDLGATSTTIILIGFAIGVFVPIRYIYPSRTETLRTPTLVLSVAFFVAFVAIVALLPDPPLWLVIGSMGYIAYSMALSIWLTVQGTNRRTDPTDLVAS